MSGTISGSYASSVTLSVTPTTIANTATISSAAEGVVGVYGPTGTDWVLTNQGLVSETDASSFGVSFADAGTITNTASASITGGAAGILLAAGGSVTNQTDGGIGGYRGVAGTGAATTVDNAGSIQGAGYLSNTAGAGVYLGAGGLVSNRSGGTISGYYGVDARNSVATVVNAGLIAGNYTSGSADGVYLGAGGSVTNQSGGTIKGDNDGVRISGAVGTVDNLGTISPSNFFSGGDGVYLKDGGVVTNGTSGGTVSGAYIRGYQYGVGFGSSGGDGTLTNYGTISGNPGHPAVSMATGTIINGPSGATGARIEGGDQASAVMISGAATIINFATIVGFENPGDTPIYYGISLGGAGSISNLGTKSLIENYVGIYASFNDTVTNAGTIASNYVGGRDALVFGGGTNRLIIDPGASFIGAVSGGGAVTLAPSGNTTVIGTANGVGTTTLELASGASDGTLSGLGTKYVGFSAVTIDANASWTFSGANTLIAGVMLTDSGTLADSGTFTNAGAITGAANGILLTTGATLTNQSGGSITGSTIGVSASGAATVVNAGSIGGDPSATGGAGVSLAAGGSVTNQSGGTITGAVGVYASSVAATVVNAGSIGGNATSGTGVFLQFGGTITNQTGGAISGGADAVTLAADHTNRLVIDPGAVFTGTVDGGNTIGAASISTLELGSGTGIGTLSGLGAQYIDFAQVTIDAAAVWTLDGTATGFATLTNAGSLASGVTLGAGSFTVSNQSSGTIAGAAGVVAIGSADVVNAGSIAGTAIASDGIDLEAGGSVTNQPSGTITGALYGINAAHGVGTVINTGHIISVNSDDNSGIGVQLLAGSVTNASGGIITGGGFGVRITNGGYITNALGGTITGADGVYSYAGPFTLVNAGSVSGAGTYSLNGGAYLWHGGSVTNVSSGTITGYCNGIAVFNNAGAVSNAGSIAGTHLYGIQLGSGGTVNNASGGTISGGSDGIRIRGGSGTVINAGNIAGTTAAVIFAAGVVNRLVVDPGATFTGTVDGGNTIGAAQVSTLELASGASAGTLSGLGTQFIDFAQSTIDVSANWILSGANTLVAGATLTNSGTLTDVGTVTGNQIRLSGGALTIQASGLLTSTYVYGVAAGGTDTVVNYGTITTSAFSAVYLKAAGNVSNAAGALISGYGATVKLKGTDATLSNLGQITSTSTGPGGYGIYLRNGGLVTNGQGGSGTSTASIQGYYGVTFKAVEAVNAYGTLVNFGTILGTGTDSSGVQLDGGTVFNGQSGATAALIDGGRYGVSNDQGTVVNYATIIAAGSASGDYGIAIQGAGSVGNLGTASLIEGYGGVLIGTDGTVTNAGTIESGQGTSGVAVSFTDGNARLIDDPGAAFIGSIFGGSGGTAVLELASASGVGTLTGVGTSITNFTSLVFDAGAQWTVAGNDLATGLGTLGISGFIIGDTIDLTDFDAASKTFDDGTDTLVLADDGGFNHATLHMAGVFTTADFFLSPDSNGGTFITTDAPCYRAGTRILTPSGEVPVEQLAIGDLIVTRSGEAKPIKWIGRRSYAARFIAGNHDVLPIRFAANALADGIPSRDLDVSPKHAMFIDEVLVPAEMLVNGISIRQLMDEDSVEYVHIELASHDIIIAEGADSETFVDCDSRTMFHNAADYTRRYPDDPGPVWQFCAPRIEPASPALVAIRARLAARAGLSEVIGAPEALQGNIDLCDRTRMYGWVFDPTQPKQRARLEVYCDGELVGHVVADRHRHDLEKAGYLGDGRCSFDFTHPIHLSPLSDHMIELRRAADGAPIPGSPVRLPAMSGFDADGRAAVAQMLSDATQAATKASDLDELIVHQMTQVEALLAARARLDAGARADATSLHDRWGGLVPTAAVRRSASELRPQALFVDDMLPASGVSGGANAAIDHMRALLRIGFDVSFVASQDLGDRHGRAVELAALGIRPLLAPWYGSVEEVLRRHTGRIDVVYLHRAGNAAAYGKLVRQYCPRALLVYGVADLHHLRLARQGAVEDRPEVSRYAERLRIEELMAARLADVVITHSHAEAALLRAQLPGVTVAQVPWSVPLRQSGIGFAEREGIVFVGNFGHAPNADAVHWLAQEIVPLVQQQDPAIRFRVIGNDMPESLRRRAPPGLELVGSVERLDRVYDAARLTVAPLRYGAGIKAKVIESLAAGVPCVGTNIAFEGMALPTALSSCIADTPAAFAAALIGLYRDEAAHASTAEAGQRYALVNNSEVCVDGLMRQALAPALRQWAGITEELGGASVVQ